MPRSQFVVEQGEDRQVVQPVIVQSCAAERAFPAGIHGGEDRVCRVGLRALQVDQRQRARRLVGHYPSAGGLAGGESRPAPASRRPDAHRVLSRDCGLARGLAAVGEAFGCRAMR